MKFSSKAVSAVTAMAGVALFLPTSTTNAFTPSTAFVRSNRAVATTNPHSAGCPCSSCAPKCPKSCDCGSCGPFATMLFAEISNEATIDEVEDVPKEIQDMDGIESEQEAHNQERINNRGSLKKHKEREGTAIGDLEVGSMVAGKVKSITSYGAFIDIGATTDGLLHISALSNEFVSDVNDVLKEGQDIEVRIVNVDSNKNQVQLSMMSEEEESKAQGGGRQQSRGGGGRGGGGGPSRNEKIAIQNALQDAGWNTDSMIEGEVVNTLDFGAFINFDVSQLNPDVTGVIDGLCHISCLQNDRTNAVSDVVKTGDKVQVRVKSISDGKVALSMITADEESAARAERRSSNNNDEAVDSGPADWKDQFVALSEGDDAIVSKTFVNGPLIVDRR